MWLLRVFAWSFEEALTSLWRSRLMNTLSVGTIAVSLFVLGSFLVLADNLAGVVERWAEKVQVTFYLRDDADDAGRRRLEKALAGDAAVSSVEYVSREQAVARFRSMFAELATLPDELETNPFPASLEVTLDPGPAGPEHVRRLADAFGSDPVVDEVHYDLLWVERLTTAVRLVRGVGAFLGGILVLAGVFTISNVIRLTVYARQDELDIMRLVGASRSYVKGPFVVEGMLQGGLGGLLAVALLWVSLRWIREDVLAGSNLVGSIAVELRPELGLLLVAGGMAVGVVGSVVSLGRTRV